MIFHKLVTLVKHPHKAIQKYFRLIILRQVIPVCDENYDECYNYIDFYGKTVLDVGADYGSTAYYFLRKGVSHIVAVEGDKTFFQRLTRNYGGHKQVECVYKHINSPTDFEHLINQYPCDIVKVDIEHSEKHLANVNPKVASKIKTWMIETHTPEIYRSLSKYLLNLDYQVFAIHYMPQLEILLAQKKVI